MYVLYSTYVTFIPNVLPPAVSGFRDRWSSFSLSLLEAWSNEPMKIVYAVPLKPVYCAQYRIPYTEVCVLFFGEGFMTPTYGGVPAASKPCIARMEVHSSVVGKKQGDYLVAVVVYIEVAQYQSEANNRSSSHVTLSFLQLCVPSILLYLHYCSYIGLLS